MRAALVATVMLVSLVPARASASAIYAYEFEVIASPRSSLRLANGDVVDVSNLLFTATGIATDEPAYHPAFPTVYKATTTYHFGELGTYRTEQGSDMFWTFGFIGLGYWNPIDWAGLAPGRQAIYSYGSGNTAGQGLFLYVGLFGEPGHLEYVAPRVVAYDIRALPEPATLLLLSTGLAAVAYAQRRAKRT